MAYDEGLAERIRERLRDRTDVIEKRMFGGLAFMVAGHMALGVMKEDLMVRVPPAEQEKLLGEKGTRREVFPGRPMKGIIVVGPTGHGDDAALEKWVERGLRCVARKGKT